MNVFFSTSVSRRRSILPVAQDIARDIEQLGHTVLTKHLVDPEYAQAPNWDKDLDAKAVYDDAFETLKRADVLITECTEPSFGAAFFIDSAIEMGKPVLSLHYGERLEDATLMLRGKPGINLQIYNEETLRSVLKQFFDSLEKTT